MGNVKILVTGATGGNWWDCYQNASGAKGIRKSFGSLRQILRCLSWTWNHSQTNVETNVTSVRTSFGQIKRTHGHGRSRSYQRRIAHCPRLWGSATLTQ